MGFEGRQQDSEFYAGKLVSHSTAKVSRQHKPTDAKIHIFGALPCWCCPRHRRATGNTPIVSPGLSAEADQDKLFVRNLLEWLLLLCMPSPALLTINNTKSVFLKTYIIVAEPEHICLTRNKHARTHNQGVKQGLPHKVPAVPCFSFLDKNLGTRSSAMLTKVRFLRSVISASRKIVAIEHTNIRISRNNDEFMSYVSAPKKNKHGAWYKYKENDRAARNRIARSTLYV